MIPTEIESFSVDLGGMNVLFKLVSPGIPITVSPGYTDFLSSEAPEAQINVHLTEYQGQPLGIPCFTASHWAAYRLAGDGLAIEFGQQDMPPGKYAFTFLLDGTGQLGDLYLNKPKSGRDLSSLVLPPVMLDEVMALSLLARRRGMIFHACAVQEDESSAFLFAGFSGSGKTTTAHLWQDYSSSRLLGDERVVVRRKGGLLRVFATPWFSPEFSLTAGSAPLTRLFILKHSSENQARRLGVSEAVKLLLARCYLPAWDAAGMEYTLEFLEEVCRSVPCYELGFTPDRRAVEYVQWLKDS